MPAGQCEDRPVDVWMGKWGRGNALEKGDSYELLAANTQQLGDGTNVKTEIQAGHQQHSLQ